MSDDHTDLPDDSPASSGPGASRRGSTRAADADQPASRSARPADAADQPASHAERPPDTASQSGSRSGDVPRGASLSTTAPAADAPGGEASASSPLADGTLEALSAFVDGELPPAESAAVRERIAADSLAASRVGNYRAQRAALQALCGSMAGDDDDGASSASPACIVLRPREPWWWRVAVAASWVAAGAGLTLAAGALIRHGVDGGTFFADDGAAFARRADVAYAVYSPEQRHPVEVGADDEAHLVSWLSKRLGRTLSVPSLREYGYTLVGGRLLPGGAGPAAQFMYENDAGERLTLYVSPATRDVASVGSLRDGRRRTFYWASGRTGYALSGTIAEGKLREIAVDVCSELGGDPARWSSR